MRVRNVVMAAAVGLGLAATAAPDVQPAPIQMQAVVSSKRKRALFNGAVLPETECLRAGRRGAGISMAQQQRAATKKRNRARHRRACR